MHSFEGPNGTRFTIGDKDALIQRPCCNQAEAMMNDLRLEVNKEDLLAFADHVRRERNEDFSLSSTGPARLMLPHGEPVADPDREKREFIRRAAIAIWAETQHMGDEFAAETAVIRAQKLWDALQEKGL